jgi:pimeloyl-ACP methyl ester carboxylesterase
VAGLILMAVLLRAIVYFRDNYRASNYGVNDLIQIIRAIDHEVVEQRRLKGLKAEPDQRVQLSFIGHSMGGFVVTNAIRTLSDVFKTKVEALSHYGVNAPPPPREIKKIGKAFELRRFVLASPDIPAETLLSNRGNFLAAALSRFDEAFLFSNEGDEVLRQISTLANYFVFPTNSSNNGFRLGNVEILRSDYGLIKPGPDEFLKLLRIGNLTLQQLYDQLEDDEASRQQLDGKKPAQPRLPGVFTYFDCTDYVELDSSGNKQGLLTFALCAKRTNPKAKLRWYSHQHLLIAYVFRHQKPNVHGGYFQGALSQQLIYRLACLGYRATVAAYGDEALFGRACEEKQIRVLVSPALALQQAGQPIAAAAAAMAEGGGPTRPT